MEIQGEILVEDFNMLLSKTSSQLKASNDTLVLKSTINKTALMNICRTLFLGKGG